MKPPRSNIRWKPVPNCIKHGKPMKRRDRVVIEKGVSFERWEYEQAMRFWRNE
jgi:hypothetical protein